MASMNCDICGGSEFIKEKDMFICQCCGTKYTLEDARKLFRKDHNETNETEKVSASEVIPDVIEQLNEKDEKSQETENNPDNSDSTKQLPGFYYCAICHELGFVDDKGILLYDNVPLCKSCYEKISRIKESGAKDNDFGFFENQIENGKATQEGKDLIASVFGPEKVENTKIKQKHKLSSNAKFGIVICCLILCGLVGERFIQLGEKTLKIVGAFLIVICIYGVLLAVHNRRIKNKKRNR